jgi:murein DD-endopeptidase MepM/ murein hydrolase activator NlpD
MKPSRFLLPLFLSTPALAPVVAAIAVNDRGASTEVIELALPEIDTSSAALSGFDGAASTDIDFQPPVVRQPVEVASSATDGTAASTDSNSGRGVVRFGDTLVKIAQRYRLTLSELLRLNPGLETARLVVGSQIRVAQSSPDRSQTLIALNPVGSGGVSWPDLPDYGNEGRPLRGTTVAGREWIWPTKGTFTSGYGWRWGRMHKGIDVANNVGTPIVAARDGRVTFSGWSDGGYGYLVELTHPDGSISLYAHNSRLLVREGEAVQQGQMISRMGSTGRSTGPHLHFEIRPAGKGAVNPLSLLPPRA